MKQEVFRPLYLNLSRVVAFLISPYYYFFNFFKEVKPLHSIEIRTILVAEYHRIGDVLMILPALRALKNKFNNAKIILICSPEASNLCTRLGIVDEVIPFQPAWANWSFSPIKWYNSFTFARSLGKRNIDLAVDFKGDIRNSCFLWNTNSKYSIGYISGGGEYFFSRPFPFPFTLHQTKRALNLVSKIGANGSLNRKSIIKNNPEGYIVFHSGAIDKRRQWPIKNWIKLISSFPIGAKLAVVETDDSKNLAEEVKKNNLPVYVYQDNIVGFMNWLKNQRILIAPDSMAGHLGAYLNIPVISLFGAQNPELTKPLGDRVLVLKPNKKCDHIRDHWRLCSLCMNEIRPETVLKSIFKLIKY
tara:strand:+ start:16598 stop:17674 length:1077 start_codon:yes stop_codon:yes gene_type:complete